jgi:hypothetical protein
MQIKIALPDDLAYDEAELESDPAGICSAVRQTHEQLRQEGKLKTIYLGRGECQSCIIVTIGNVPHFLTAHNR